MLLCIYCCTVKSTWSQLRDSVIVLEQAVIPSINHDIDLKQSIIALDSLELVSMKGQTLSELLLMSNIHVLSYGGAGALSSVRLRGASGDQSLVLFEGVPINSVTEGGADLGLLPVAAFDQIDVFQGGTGTVLGSGAFGGAISLSNDHTFDPKLNLAYNKTIGSFHNQSDDMKVRLSNEKWIFSSVYYRHDGLNDFDYYDKIAQKQLSRIHNRFFYQGEKTSVSYRPTLNWIIQVHQWSQEREKELPSILGASTQSSKFQEDDFHRFVFSTKYIHELFRIQYKSAYFNDFLHYTDKESPQSKVYLVDSKINGRRFYNELNVGTKRYHSHQLEWSTIYQDIIAISKNINTESSAKSISSVLDYSFKNQRTYFSFSSRFVKDRFKDQKWLYALVLSEKWKGEILQTRFNISTRYKSPDINDLYWVKSGNPDLTFEHGFGGDLEVFGNKKWSFLNLQYSNAAFVSRIKDQIVWRPSAEGFWRPQNLSEVQTYGNESSLKMEFKISKLTLKLNELFSYTNSSIRTKTDKNYLNQLPYLPKIKSTTSLSLQYWHSVIKYTYLYTGEMFTTTDNNLFYSQKPVSLHCVSYHQRFTESIQMSVRIDNLFNTPYTIIRSYPMSGRSYTLTFSFNLNSKFGKNEE